MFTYTLYKGEILKLYVRLQLYNFLFTYSDTYGLMIAALCSQNTLLLLDMLQSCVLKDYVSIVLTTVILDLNACDFSCHQT